MSSFLLGVALLVGNPIMAYYYSTVDNPVMVLFHAVMFGLAIQPTLYFWRNR